MGRPVWLMTVRFRLDPYLRVDTLIETAFPLAVTLILPVQAGLSNPQSAARYPLTVVRGGKR